MMKYKKIYVLAPYGYATGGVELSHQLVSRLRDKGHNAYIVYVNISNYQISKKQDVNASYTMYNIKTVNNIEDKPSNILILPEVFFEFILYYHEIKIGCWWMSVDNRYKASCLLDKFHFEKNTRVKVSILYNYFIKRDNSKYLNSDSMLKEQDYRITHLYQSCYAQQHLYRKGFSKVLPLGDYINVELIGCNNTKRENIVLYNPAKGMNFTEKIILSLPHIKFVPLKDLTREQLRNLLSSAKLYIDFGSFPGKDRLPREAAINNCCIITGKQGASYFFEDLPIDTKYKFEAIDKNICSISKRIEDVLANYYSCICDFDLLRRRIKEEKDVFYKEIDYIFG